MAFSNGVLKKVLILAYQFLSTRTRVHLKTAVLVLYSNFSKVLVLKS